MIIACDTSSMICSVSVTDKKRTLESWESAGAQVHIEQLSPFLAAALELVSGEAGKLDALAIAIGPGSFNGLRIGLATMKALALARNLPLIPVFSTDALALGMAEGASGRGRAMIFSHRNFVHHVDYEFDGRRSKRVSDFQYDGFDDLFDEKVDFYFGAPERGLKTWLDSGTNHRIATHFRHIDPKAHYVGLQAAEFTEAIPDLDMLEPFYNAHYEAKKWVPPEF